MQIDSGATTAQDKWITQILRAYRTLHEMLRDRGFLVSDSTLETTRDELKTKLGMNSVLGPDGTATQKRTVDCQHLN